MKVDLILLLDKFGYPPVTMDDVYKEVLEQAENFKKYAEKLMSSSKLERANIRVCLKCWLFFICLTRFQISVTMICPPEI